IEPLRTVVRRHLCGQHVAGLIQESTGVRLAGEVSSLPTPVSPTTGEAAKNLTGVRLVTGAAVTRAGPTPLKPPRHARFGNALYLGRHARPAKILLREDVDRHLRPVLRCQ